jgi:hypothetical protein
MSGFEVALRALKDGRKVRRVYWGQIPDTMERYIYLEIVQLDGFEPELVAVLNTGRRTFFDLNTHQMLCEDWEVIE